ncbi:MAG: translation elongation factor Ts [Myxococcota bacterium]
MGISAKQVKELRDRTGAGMMDCKKALQETDGDMDAAIEHLEKKGMAAAQKKAGRVAAEGLVNAWVDSDHTEAVLVEVNCETDFVTRNDQFREFVEKVTKAIGESEVSEDADFHTEVTLVGTDKTIEKYTTEQIAAIGENMSVRRFARFTVDDGYVGTYIHAGDQIGVLVKCEVEDEVDNDVEAFARDVAMHVAAMNPPYLNPGQIPADEREDQERIFAEQMKEEGKPEDIIPRIVQGKIGKWESEVSLLKQPFVKDADMTVEEFQKDVGGVSIVDFVRFEVGEGIEKEEADLAAEVAEQLKS